MAKNNKLVKKITIEKLAEMIKEGFDKTATLVQMENVEKKIDSLEKDVSAIKKDVKEIKYKLNDVTGHTDKLEMRVDYVENILDIPVKKH